MTVQHVLLVRPSALGDVCRTVPVLASLRRAWPEARIDWLVQEEYVASVAAHPDLTSVVPFPRRRFGDWLRRPGGWRAMAGWLRGLRRARYDVVIDCQGLARSGLLSMVTGAPRRIGFAGAREGGWLGYTERHPLDPGAHTVDQMLSLVEAAGLEPVRSMRLHVAEDDRAWWDETSPDMGCHGATFAVVAPTSRWPGKRWSGASFGALVPRLLERGFDRVVVCGAPGEADQAAAMLAACAADGDAIVDLVGATSVGGLLAVIEGAGLVIANDSAPLHMAVGLDTPCLGLYGPTDPAKVGPYRLPRSAMRAPGAEATPTRYRAIGASDTSMQAITVASVVQRLDELLEPTPATP